MKEKGNLITDNQKLPNIFNTYFINITDPLQLKRSPLKLQSLSLKLFLFYENHDKLSKVKEKNIIPKEFCFKEVSSNEVKRIIESLNRKKTAISSCFLVIILGGSMDIYLPLLIDIINDFLKRCKFPDELKLAEVMSLFKNVEPFGKTNNRLVSLVSYNSKVFERIIYNQINEYTQPFPSKVLAGFRKNHNPQNSLLKMLENFKGNSVNDIFMDLSGAFDTLNHDFLIAKLEAYSFSAKSFM